MHRSRMLCSLRSRTASLVRSLTLLLPWPLHPLRQQSVPSVTFLVIRRPTASRDRALLPLQRPRRLSMLARSVLEAAIRASRRRMLLLRRLPPALLLRQLRTPSPPLPLQTALSSLDMQVALLFHRFLPDLTGLQTQAPLFI